MTTPDTPDQEDAPAPAKTQSKEKSHLSIMAWVAVVLTAVVAFIRLSGNPTMGWVFAVMAVISVGCSWVAFSRVKKTASGQGGISPLIALLVSVGLLVYSVMGLLAHKKRDHSFAHAGNESTLAALEVMLDSRYEETKEYPAALSDLKKEAMISPDATIDDFLSYVDPQTGEEKPWIYVRTSAHACTVESEPYQFDGRQVTLSLRKTGGEP